MKPSIFTPESKQQIYEAIVAAIEQMGIANFKKTSFFLSNEKKRK